MTDALVHRGPDDRGTYDAPEISLGFRRLAVIDLETGQQPIRLEDDRAVIVLNGEIYNFRELRRELEPRHGFRTRGDVEVVLRLYDEQGVEGLGRLNGMFALAIWDRSRRTLVLARDRFGIKPLFVHEAADGWVFASELGALLDAGFPETREIDRLELRHYLSQKHGSPQGSFLAGVRSLPPATVVEIGPAGTRTSRFWQAPPPISPRITPAEAVERTAGLLAEATRRQLVADVPVGVFLSGGIDSGTLAAIVRHTVTGPVQTFSIGFDDPEVADELPAAAALAARLGTDHHELRLEPGGVARDLPRILGALDGPLGDATVIPTWYMSGLARADVTVALSGEGADELFGGYGRQRFDPWIDRLGGAGRRILPLALRARGRRVSPGLRRRLGMPAGIERQLDWSRVFGAAEIDALALEPLASESAMLAVHRELDRRFLERTRVDAINARLETDRELFLVLDLLPKVDRMSMARSLEVRVPYLDNDLADFVLACPGTLKLRRGRTKWLLRRCASRWLPAEVTSRRKQGFDVPVSAWLRGALREPMTDLLSGETVRRRGLFRPAVVDSMVTAHLSGAADHGARLWSLMALEGWMQGAFDRRPAGRHA